MSTKVARRGHKSSHQLLTTTTEETRAPVRREPTDPEVLEAGPRTVLITLVQAGDVGLTKPQISVRACFAKSTRDLYIRALKRQGLVGGTGDRVTPTATSRAKLGAFVPLATGEALREQWYERLPAGEGRLLSEICAVWPQHADRTTLSERTEFAKSTRDLYLRALKRRFLITGGHEVRAVDDLFDA